MNKTTQSIISIALLILSFSVAYFVFVRLPAAERRTRLKQAVEACEKHVNEALRLLNEELKTPEAQLRVAERLSQPGGLLSSEFMQTCPEKMMERWGY